MKIKIQWEVSDGYAGGSRPHSFNLESDDFEGMSEREVIREVEEQIQQDFEQKVSWVCDYTEAVSQIMATLKEAE